MLNCPNFCSPANIVRKLYNENVEIIHKTRTDYDFIYIMIRIAIIKDDRYVFIQNAYEKKSR